jgi:hypothetical protein
MSLERLHRKLRFSPKMGGNREEVTLPCSFVGQLIYLVMFSENSTNVELRQEIAALEEQAEEILKQPVRITQGTP